MPERPSVHPFLDVVFGSRPASGTVNLNCIVIAPPRTASIKMRSSISRKPYPAGWHREQARETYHATSPPEIQEYRASDTPCPFYENTLWRILSGLRTKKNRDPEHLFFSSNDHVIFISKVSLSFLAGIAQL